MRDLLFQTLFLAKLFIELVQLECGSGVLHGIVRFRLDANAEKVPGEESQRNHALVWQMEELYGVHNLFGWDDYIDNPVCVCVMLIRIKPHEANYNGLPKIVLQPVPDEDHSDIDEVAKFLIGILQCRQVLLADVRIQVARLNAGEFGQIVDHLFLRGNVVVDEWNGLFGSLSERSIRRVGMGINNIFKLRVNLVCSYPLMHVIRATLI